MLRAMYFLSSAPREQESKAVSTKQKKKESPLVRKRQNTALDLQHRGENAEVASARASAATKANQLRHCATAGCIRERHASPHRTWFNVRERLKDADIIRKADLQTIASFLRQVLKTHSTAERDDVKVGAASSPREIVEPGEFATEEKPDYHFKPKRKTLYEQSPLPASSEEEDGDYDATASNVPEEKDVTEFATKFRLLGQSIYNPVPLQG
jgi:hypothetical protein